MKTNQTISYHSTKSSDQRGFALIETMIAMVFFFLAFAAMAAMFGKTVQTNDLAVNNTRIAAIAYEQMDLLFALPYDDPLLEPGAAQVINLGLNRTLTWTVTQDTLLPGTKVITMTLNWFKDIPRQYNLTFVKPEIT